MWVLNFGYLRLAMALTPFQSCLRRASVRRNTVRRCIASGKAMGSLNWFAVHPTSMTSDLDALNALGCLGGVGFGCWHLAEMDIKIGIYSGHQVGYNRVLMGYNSTMHNITKTV